MKNICISFSALLIAFIMNTTATLHAQQNFKVILSPTGHAYFSLHLKSFDLDISQNGEILSFTGLNNGKIEYNTMGRIDNIDGSKITWDYMNRLASVGEVKFQYDFLNRLNAVGAIQIDYDFLSGKISSIDKKSIGYDFITGKINQVGQAVIKYDINGNITGIDDKENITAIRSYNFSRT